MDIIKNARRNIKHGVINKLVLMLCPFVERTIIQQILGAEYLGLNSLYTSILSVLSLTEMGFTSAVIYNMYKPTAEGDVKKVNAFLNFYKNTYRIMGCIILVIGLCLIPILPRLINGSYPSDVNLTVLYLVFLFNSVISYFLYAYLTSVLVANQRDDVQSSVNSIVRLLSMSSQVIMLLLIKNYYAFIIVMPVFTIINNLWTARRVRQLFPQYRAEGRIDSTDIERIKKLVSGTFIQRMCAVTRNSLDSICISAFMGLTLTAVYNNYYLIMNGITVFVGVIHSAFSGGVGNHVVTKSVDENFKELINLNFLYLWISGWCAICLCNLYQPFMELWMGKSMMLPYSAVILLSIYFYFLKLCDIPTVYSAANGLWWEHRHRAIVETVINLVLNIILGRIYGVLGIIIATNVSVFTCTFLWGTYIIFKNYFSVEKFVVFLKINAIQTIIMVAATIVVMMINSIINVDSPILNLFFRFIVCAIIPNAILVCVYHKSEQYKYIVNRVFSFTSGNRR